MSRLAPRRTTLKFESLEDRSVPTAFGIPWADSDHITLSFAPDGTETPLGTSDLTAALAPAGSSAAWQREILRAYQAWAVHADLDIGVVADGGQPLGVVGAVQGDSRFGDVRIAAAPLSNGIVANTSPFSWTGTTHSGDMILSASQIYAIGNVTGKYDVYSVALHEAGHSFGLPHRFDDPTSVEFREYKYISGGLPAVDIAGIQALYGARAPDAFDAAIAGGNNVTAQASLMPRSSANQYLATGDLTTSSDVDFYKFTATLGQGLPGATIRLKAAGLSLLTPSVTVYNSAGEVVGAASSTNPLNNDLSIQINSLLGGTYTVKVDRADAAFDVGGYVLTVDYGVVNGALNLVNSLLAPLTDGHTNDTISKALKLEAKHPNDARFDAIYRGVIEDASDVDTYNVKTAKYDAGTLVTVNVMVWGLDANPVDTRIRMFNKNGNPVAFQVLANDNGVFSLQIPNAPANDYYVQVSARDTSGSNRTGSYFLAVDYNRLNATVFDAVAAGTVSAGTTKTASLVIPEARLFQFALAAGPLQSGTGGVTMTVYDAIGNVAFSLSATAGQPPVTAIRYMKAGAYTVRYSSTSGGSSPVGYGLYLLELSDPVGTLATTTSTSPPPPTAPPSSTGYTYTSSTTASPTMSYGYTF